MLSALLLAEKNFSAACAVYRLWKRVERRGVSSNDKFLPVIHDSARKRVRLIERSIILFLFFFTSATRLFSFFRRNDARRRGPRVPPSVSLALLSFQTLWQIHECENLSYDFERIKL